MSPIGSGTHYEGPVLGSGNSGGGLYRNLPMESVGRTYGKYKIWQEDFKASITPTADGLVAAGAGTGMNGAGWTVTQIGAVAGNTVGTVERNVQLLINCGTAADTGYNLQHNFVTTAAATSPYHDVFGPVASTAIGWNNREVIFGCRLNYLHTGAWGSKFAIGIGVTDTSYMTPTTGVIDGVGTGGATMFHVDEAGVLSAAQHRTGGVPLTLTTLKNPIANRDGLLLTTNDWLELGFRMSYGIAATAADTKNFTEWYINGRRVATTSLNNPMTSTQSYCVTIEAMNGAAGTENLRLAIDYLFTAVSRAGDQYNNNP